VCSCHTALPRKEKYIQIKRKNLNEKEIRMSDDDGWFRIRTVFALAAEVSAVLKLYFTSEVVTAMPTRCDVRTERDKDGMSGQTPTRSVSRLQSSGIRQRLLQSVQRQEMLLRTRVLSARTRLQRSVALSYLQSSTFIVQSLCTLKTIECGLIVSQRWIEYHNQPENKNILYNFAACLPNTPDSAHAHIKDCCCTRGAVVKTLRQIGNKHVNGQFKPKRQNRTTTLSERPKLHV